jgi:hypothetical protein
MRILKPLLLGLVLALSPLLTFADDDKTVNGIILANAGTRFQLSDDNHDGILEHAVNGLAQVSHVGNCFVSFDVLVEPAPPGKRWKLTGTMQIVTADKKSVLNLEVTGSVLPDDDTPFGNFHYDAVIKSGTGRFDHARGRAEIDGAAMFINREGTEGTATWLLRGFVFTRAQR